MAWSLEGKTLLMGRKSITDYYPHVQYYGTVQYCVQQSAASPCWTLIALYDCTGFDIGIIIVARGALRCPCVACHSTRPARQDVRRIARPLGQAVLLLLLLRFHLLWTAWRWPYDHGVTRVHSSNFLNNLSTCSYLTYLGLV